jgi:hypothetical protein
MFFRIRITKKNILVLIGAQSEPMACARRKQSTSFSSLDRMA